MSEPDDDDLFAGTEDEPVQIAPRPRRLLVIFGVALAAFVFIGVAAAALVLVLVVRVRDRADPNHDIRLTYQHRYTACVRAGNVADTCSATVLLACEKDSYWNNPKRVGQRETVCESTVPD